MSFQVRDTEVPDVKEVYGPRFPDQRGSFQELWRASELGSLLGFTPVQENSSCSEPRGTVRGFHFQRPPHAQAKLVQVIHGAVFDVAVDLRSGSDTYGRWVARELSGEGAVQLFVPRGFAHGFVTLEPRTVVVYLLDAYYESEAESGVHWRSPGLDIPWPDLEEYVISDKDRALPAFAELNTPF